MKTAPAPKTASVSEASSQWAVIRVPADVHRVLAVNAAIEGRPIQEIAAEILRNGLKEFAQRQALKMEGAA